VPAGPTLQRARESARHALAIDPGLSEPHAVLGAVAALHDWDWATAGREFQLAIAHNPQDQIARTWYANYFLAPLGRLDEALAANADALRLDRMSPIINASTGMLLTFARRYEEAVARFRAVLELEPQFLYARYFLGRAESELGHHAAAIEALERTAVLSDGNGVVIAALAHALARSGDLEEARALLARLEALRSSQFVSSFQFALAHAGLGDTEAALASLERAAEERSAFMVGLAVQPGLDALRAEPRCRALLARIGIAPPR